MQPDQRCLTEPRDLLPSSRKPGPIVSCLASSERKCSLRSSWFPIPRHRRAHRRRPEPRVAFPALLQARALFLRFCQSQSKQVSAFAGDESLVRGTRRTVYRRRALLCLRLLARDVHVPKCCCCAADYTCGLQMWFGRVPGMSIRVQMLKMVELSVVCCL